MTYSLMVQGTTSDAGKTTLVAGLGRVLARRGISVAPFKPQNMALNSAVTATGGEIGRAQALQAAACRVTPNVDMNPILLKPSSDIGAQVVVHGRAIGTMDARTYHAYKPSALAAVMASYERLCAKHDVILIEGAGSPAEINLRDGDIANMGFAEAADCPVVLIADIDKGGVFAHLVGTLDCLSATERARITGFVINKFRGDLALLEPGNVWLQDKTSKPVFGVLPYWQGLYLDAEDAISTFQTRTPEDSHLKVVVPVLPRISNHTDLDPLRQHPQVDIEFVPTGSAPPAADLIVLPGSKNVMADLVWLRENGWETAIKQHLRYGGRVLGLCGGFQMLGDELLDDAGIEGPTGACAGLGLLQMTTRLMPEKKLRESRGQLVCLDESPLAEGYEIHCGISSGPALERPAIALAEGGTDGAVSVDGQIIGTYFHGLLEHPDSCQSILKWAGLSSPQRIDTRERREHDLERIADSIESELALNAMFPFLADLSPA